MKSYTDIEQSKKFAEIMTQEDRLEEAKRLYQTANADRKYVLERLFPELKVEQEELIKKAIIEHLKETYEFIGRDYELVDNKRVYHSDIIAWVEKQSNKTEEYIFRPVADCTIDEAARQAIYKVTNGENIVFSFNGFYMKIYKDTTIDNIINSYNDFCKKQGKSKWTDEDEKNLRDIIDAIHRVSYQTTEAEVERTDWLQSLKQRMEEQQ